MHVHILLFVIIYSSVSVIGRELSCVELETVMGKIILETVAVHAPVTAPYFLVHVKKDTLKTMLSFSRQPNPVIFETDNFPASARLHRLV